MDTDPCSLEIPVINDSDVARNRIIVFATDGNFQRLCESLTVYSDGTFNIPFRPALLS